MKIAVLDFATIGLDLDLSPLDVIGERVVYENSAPEEVAERIGDAEIVFGIWSLPITLFISLNIIEMQELV